MFTDFPYSPLHEGEGEGEGAALSVPPELLLFARQLRKEQTDAENLLWKELRGRRFCGFKFRRQYPMCGYILDFYCHDAGLAVELDGGGHNNEEQRVYDAERTKALEAASIRVVRFWNNDVLNNVQGVLEQLYMQLIEENAVFPHSPLRGTFSFRPQRVPKEKG